MKKNIGEIRIVFVASGDLWAGAEVMLYQLITGLARIDGISIAAILLNRGGLALKLERLGIQVYIIDESENTFLKSIGAGRRLLKALAPDIVHSHRYKENVLAWCATRGALNCKLVATQHGLPEIGKNPSVKDRLRTVFFFRLLSARFIRTVVVSEDMQSSLVGRYGFSEKNVIVIHNGISIPEVVNIPPSGRLIVGSAGRFCLVKDFALLIDIARLVIRQNATVEFVLAGDGPERCMLEKKVDQYGLRDRFRFLGHRRNMAPFYKGLDVYINTSVHEGIPMSVLEAMSYGLPVVAPKIGGFPEIIDDGVNGFLVEGRQPDVFAQCILRLLSPAKREEFGRAARARVVTSFSREVMTQQYVQLYRDLTGR